MSYLDIIQDNSHQNLTQVPENILLMSNLRMLYLQQNFIQELPQDFFLKLPQLSWLDLRDNQLFTIPLSIANHQCLENLLLSNNKIEVLPYEVGLVPKLKVLQVANNPIAYPGKKILALGTRAVCDYLKREYEKMFGEAQGTSAQDSSSKVARDEEELREEKEVKVDDYYAEYPVVEPINSSIVVKRFASKDSKQEDTVIVHKISTHPSNKILLKSYYDEDVPAKPSTFTSKESLKQAWIDKLKLLLEEQEKILQQERNLQALNTWRNNKSAEPPRFVSKEEYPQAPYGTYPEYNTMLSREDLSKQIDRMIEKNKHQPKRTDIDKLLNDLVAQLKEMEISYAESQSPRSEIEAAGSQIMKIMEVHKKLLKLQEANTV